MKKSGNLNTYLVLLQEEKVDIGLKIASPLLDKVVHDLLIGEFVMHFSRCERA